MTEFCKRCELPLQEGENDLCGVCDHEPEQLPDLVPVDNHYQASNIDDRLFEEWRPEVSYSVENNMWCLLLQVSEHDSPDGEIEFYYPTYEDLMRDITRPREDDK